MPASPSVSARRSRARRGFTVIELLVVVGIIAILVGLSFVVGGKVLEGGKRGAALETIRLLDNALNDYMAKTDGLPATTVEDPEDRDRVFPVADARDMQNTDSGRSPAGNQMINSVGLFMLQAREVPSSRQILDQLPSKFARALEIDGQPVLMTAFDPWGNPIRYVHPSLDGRFAAGNTDLVLGPAPTGKQYAINQMRRNNEQTVLNGMVVNAQDIVDSDGGLCTGNRPYFYSVGPDGRAGWYQNEANQWIDGAADNIYTMTPTLPKAP